MTSRDKRNVRLRWFNSKEGRKLQEMLKMFVLLDADAELSYSEAKRRDGHSAHRQYVRSVFAMIEGTIFGMKQLARNPMRKQLTAAVLALLDEEGYDLNDRGEPIICPHYLRLEKNIKFAFAIYAESASVMYRLPTQEAGWKSLMRAIRLRNGLMHPKRLRDLSLSAEEIKNVVTAHHWFKSKYREVQGLMLRQQLQARGLADKEIAELDSWMSQKTADLFTPWRDGQQ